jgi:hypothetical protein
MARGDGTGSVEPRIAACFEGLRLTSMESRSICRLSGTFSPGTNASDVLWSLRTSMSFEQCREAALELSRLEQQREPLETFATRSRWILQNAGWRDRFAIVLDDLSDRQSWDEEYAQQVATLMRLLIMELAIRAYELETAELPTTIADLTPAILEQLPNDPFGEGPLKFQRTQDNYILYSVGANGRDDGGQFDADDSVRDDYPVSRLIRAARPRPARATTTPARTNTGK